MIVHVRSKAASMQMFCPAWSIVPPCGCRRRSFICVLLDSIVRSEGLCEGELCCLVHRRKVRALCLLYKMYDRVGHSINVYLNHFVTVRNTRASGALSELALVILRCRTDRFSRLILSATVRL